MRYAKSLVLLLAAAVATAAPPTLTAPAEVKGEVSAFVVVKATTSGKWVKYVPLDAGLSVFPSDLLSDKTVTVVVAAKAGRYRVLAYTGNEDGGADAITTLVIGTPPAPTDPPKAPAPIVSKKHFMLVRPAGPIQPGSDVEKSLALAAWNEVKAAGHTVADLPFDSLTPAARAKFAAQPTPFLLTWNYTADGQQITLPDTATAGTIPATDADVRGLIK